jgi:multiple sugar transport system permease protein
VTVTRRVRLRARRADPAAVRTVVPLLFIAPAALLILATVLVPILLAGWISLHEWSMLTPITSMAWVGLDNYAAIVRDASFVRALGNTVGFAAAFAVIALPLSLVLAVLIHQGRIRGSGVVLSVLFATYVVPTVAVALLWGYLLSPRGGPVNEILDALGLPVQPWLGSPRTALWSLVLLTIWQYLGYFTTILIAGLTQIPREYDEAAQIDGAGALTRMLRITVPLLRRPLTFATAICLINGLGVFDAVNVLTKGGPSDSTNVVTLEAVRTAFDFGSAGRAAAMTVLLLGAVIVAVGGVLLMSRDLPEAETA